MRTRALPSYLLILLCGLTAQPALASDECKDALIKSTYQRSDSGAFDWRLAERLSKEDYESITGSSSASADAEIFGVGSGSGDYDQFKQNVKSAKMGSSSSQSLTSSQANNAMWTGLDQTAGKAYQDCLAAKIYSQPGLRLVVERANANDVTLKIHWFPVGNNPKTIPLSWQGQLAQKGRVLASHSGRAGLPASVTSGQTTVIIARPTQVGSLAVNWNGITDSIEITPFPRPLANRKFATILPASALEAGGYMKYDPAQKLIVSAGPPGGPSENFFFNVNLPRAGLYRIEALWASGGPTNVHLYRDASAYKKDCNLPVSMSDADTMIAPPARGGWGANSLPAQYDQLASSLLLPPGKNRLVVTAQACGGGPSNGRLPSISAIRVTEN